MPNKYRIYILPSLITLTGIIFFVLLIIFIEKKNTKNYSTNHIQTQLTQNHTIIDNIEIIESINKNELENNDDEISVYITIANNINIREQPNINSNIIKTIPINQKLSIEYVEGKWGKILEGGFIYMELVRKN